MAVEEKEDFLERCVEDCLEREQWKVEVEN